MKIPRLILFSLAFIFALILYWPAMQGTPIWDDFIHWFHDPVMEPSMSYLTIWKDFGWPLSVSIQKFNLSLWGNNYLYHHLFNFFLHFANSLLVLLLGRELRLKNPALFFILFLLHPVAVITTAWMIQVKTLLCFFFGLASLLTFLKGQKNLKWMILSWVLFGFSLTSKSASITMPLIFLIMSIRFHSYRKLHLLIPFIILSSWSAHRVLTSPVTIEGIEKATTMTKISEEPRPAEVAVEVEVKVPKSEEPITSFQIINPFEGIELNFKLIAQTTYYYFWQVVLPLRNEPVKGLNFSSLGFEEYLHIFFIIILIIIFRKDMALIYLAAGYFLLIPFLGFIPAPFMNITWVSDQHLYLALPAFIAFWLRIIEKIPWSKKELIVAAFAIFYSYKTYVTTPIYKDQETFYRTSLAYNPYNVPISYNLGFVLAIHGKGLDGYQVVSDAYNLAQEEPLMQKNIHYDKLYKLYHFMNASIGKQNEN